MVRDDIKSAIDREEAVIFTYFQSPGFAMLRRLSPYELSEDGETVLGFDHARCELRRFSLDKINEPVQTLDDEYVRPVEDA